MLLVLKAFTARRSHPLSRRGGMDSSGNRFVTMAPQAWAQAWHGQTKRLTLQSLSLEVCSSDQVLQPLELLKSRALHSAEALAPAGRPSASLLFEIGTVTLNSGSTSCGHAEKNHLAGLLPALHRLRPQRNAHLAPRAVHCFFRFRCIGLANLECSIPDTGTFD